jgi:hypothetical protein
MKYAILWKMIRRGVDVSLTAEVDHKNEDTYADHVEIA